MRNKKYLYFIIYLIIIIVILLSFFFFINDNNQNFITKKLKGLTNKISKVIYYPFYNNYDEKDVLVVQNDTLENEIKDLKNELELKKTLVDKKIVNANTIKRSSSYWYNVISIDAGKKKGIKKGNIVMNKFGVLGKVISVSSSSSEVKLLTSKNKNNYVSAMFSYDDNFYYGLIDNYNITKNELHLKNVVGDFNNLDNINVYTSGLSKNDVKGLLIGKIKSFKKTNYGISNDIYVTPSANFNNINVVSVLIR